MEKIYKYPRTYHIEGSRLQPGDEDLNSVPFTAIANKYVVIEEKVDGANAAISFNKNGEMLLQSRGHYLTGGYRERHFNLFKQWTYSLYNILWEVLKTRYILYGEWLYAKHTVFYDYLPHYFLEFDILDLEKNQFLSTKKRAEMLAGVPLVSVPVLFAGKIDNYKQMVGLIGKSNYQQPGHLEKLREICAKEKLDIERSLKQTDNSSLMEGLYIKIEEGDVVTNRYKYVRASFLTQVLQSEEHWLNRPIIPNLLRSDVDLFKL